MAELTPKQQRFVDEYLVDLNATKAAVRAGYSAKTAHSVGWENLRKPEIQQAIEKAMNDRSARVRMTADDVLRELAILARSDVTHYTVGDNGQIETVEDAPEGALRAVSSVKVKKHFDKEGNHTSTDTELKLWDKPAALRMAGQHLGLFVERVQNDGAVEVVVRYVGKETERDNDA